MRKTTDFNGQLLSAGNTAISAWDSGYTYDANGNRNNGSNTVGTDNRLTSDGTYDYVYDDEGNLIRRSPVGSGDVVEYQWDLANRLTAERVWNSSGTLIQLLQYSYDSTGQRANA